MTKAEGMALAPWGSLGGGMFKTEEERKSNAGRQTPANDAQIKVSRVLEAIAIRKQTIITSVALAYVMQKAPYVFPIVGGRTIKHLKENIKALTLELTEEDIEEIEKAYPFVLGFPHSFMWGEKVPAVAGDIWPINMGGTFDYVGEPKVRETETKSTYFEWLYSNCVKNRLFLQQKAEIRGAPFELSSGDGIPIDILDRDGDGEPMLGRRSGAKSRISDKVN
jgi:hypothetical protein